MDHLDLSPIRCSRRALTLVESMLAMTILAVAVLGLTCAVTAGHQHLGAGDQRLHATRLAEQLLDEVITRPYLGTGGPDRADFHLDDFDDFTEGFGSLTHFTGEPLAQADQNFSRHVQVSPETLDFPQLGGVTIVGKRVTITVECLGGRPRCRLQRFVPEPTTP